MQAVARAEAVNNGGCPISRAFREVGLSQTLRGVGFCAATTPKSRNFCLPWHSNTIGSLGIDSPKALDEECYV